MKYGITIKDIYKAYLLHIKPRKIYLILGILLIGIALAACVISIKSDPKFSGRLLLCIIFVLFWIYIFPLYFIRKSYKQTKGAGDEIELTIDDNSFTLSAINFSVIIQYSDIFKIKSSPKYLLIYSNQYFFQVLPKSNEELLRATNTIEEKYTETTNKTAGSKI